jgi:hypothetical protein
MICSGMPSCQAAVTVRTPAHAFLPSCSHCSHTSTCCTEAEAVPQISNIQSIDHKIPAFIFQPTEQVTHHFVLLCAMRGLGDKSPASHPRHMWHLGWTEWYWHQFLSEFFAFPLQYHSTNASTHESIYH